MIKFIISLFDKPEEKVCADIGSGTGILSKLLVPHFSLVIGVEPNLEMRKAGENLLSSSDNFQSSSGTAESTGIISGSTDLITAAQAFHWFDKIKFKIECKRILKEKGFVALIWNNRLRNTPFLEIYDEVLKNYSVDYNEVNHQNITESQLEEFFGGEFRKKTFQNQQTFDYEGMLGRLDSSSYAPKPGTANYEIVREKLTKAFQKYRKSDRIYFNYSTELYLGQII